MSNVLEVAHNMQVAGQMLGACLVRNIPAFLWGPAGIGKSSLVDDTTAALGWGLVDITLSTMDPTDLQGQGYIVDGALRWAKPSWLVELEAFGDAPTTLFIDEMNAGTSPAMLAAALKLILNRRAGSHRLPAQCRIVAAGNRAQDRAAVTRTTGPMNNRFSHIPCGPDGNAWQLWANRHNIEPVLCAFLKFQEKRGKPALHVPGEGGDVAWPSPRSWVQAAKFIDEPESLRVHLFASQVGMAHAAEFEGFVKLHKSLPSMDAILADPRGAALPQKHATAYAISAALSRKADRSNFGAVITYAERIGSALSREFETVAVVEAVKRDPGLKETAAYVAWAVRNADALN